MPEGTIVAIGGHEDRDGDRVILRVVAEAAGAGPLLILATASRTPREYHAMYARAFEGIGFHDVRNLPVRTRDDAHDPQLLEAVAAARGVFMTGGSQVRLVEPIRDSPLHEALRDLLGRGGVIAGTSAGASALGEQMLAGNRKLRRLSGLGLVPGVVIDQHFAQRDRIGRLTTGLGRVPLDRGIGIDEDTALVIRGRHADVVGAGQVWVLDGGPPARLLNPGDHLELGDSIAA